MSYNSLIAISSLLYDFLTYNSVHHVMKQKVMYTVIRQKKKRDVFCYASRTYIHCVCMYVCMYACMHACMYICMYVCMYVCMKKKRGGCVLLCVIALIELPLSLQVTLSLYSTNALTLLNECTNCTQLTL